MALTSMADLLSVVYGYGPKVPGGKNEGGAKPDHPGGYPRVTTNATTATSTVRIGGNLDSSGETETNENTSQREVTGLRRACGPDSHGLVVTVNYHSHRICVFYVQ
jgi:hypothetical protein